MSVSESQVGTERQPRPHKPATVRLRARNEHSLTLATVFQNSKGGTHMAQPVHNPKNGNSLRHSIPHGWHTIKETARLTDISVDTLRRWRKSDFFVPDGYMDLGKTRVYLYSDADITRLRKTSGPKKGRPRTKKAS